MQFDVSAADVAVANVYAAAMTDSLTGPAMVQCLQVNVLFNLWKCKKAVELPNIFSKTTASKLFHAVLHHRPLLPSFFTQYACALE